jgi:hypothetical protein
MTKTIASLFGALLVASVGTASDAQTITAANPAQYGMGQYLSEGRYRAEGTLRSRCLEEEKADRLTTTCKQYKHELNRLLRKQSAI